MECIQIIQYIKYLLDFYRSYIVGNLKFLSLPMFLILLLIFAERNLAVLARINLHDNPY